MESKGEVTMKVMKRKKGMVFLLTAALIASLGGCTGTAVTDEQEETLSFDIVFAGEQTDTAYLEELQGKLHEDLQDLIPEGTELTVTGLSLGSEERNTEFTIASTTKAAVLFASGQVDLFLADRKTAANYGLEGGFLSLSELFSQVELEELGLETISFENVDDMGTGMGTYTEPLGLDVSEVSRLCSGIVDGTNLGIYVADCVDDTELAKEILLRLLEE